MSAWVLLVSIAVTVHGGRAKDPLDAKDFELQKGYIRVEASAIRLENPTGINYKIDYCSNFGKPCNTKCSMFIDTMYPNSHPGTDSVAFDRYAPIFNGKVNSPDINKNITRDVCGGSIRKVNIRVHCIDQGAESNTLINDFSCYTKSSTKVAATLQNAKWSQEYLCDNVYPIISQKGDTRMYYRYRMYRIDAGNCRDIGQKAQGVVSQIVG